MTKEKWFHSIGNSQKAFWYVKSVYIIYKLYDVGESVSEVGKIEVSKSFFVFFNMIEKFNRKLDKK